MPKLHMMKIAGLRTKFAGIARQAKVPVVGVTETEPAAQTWQDWMMGQLDAIAQALPKPSS